MSGNDFYFEAGPDINEAKAWGGEEFQQVDPGDYLVALAEVKRQTSKKGNPMLVATFEVVSKADGAASAFTGRRLTGWYVLTGNGLSRLKNFLTALGVPINERGGFDVSGAIGKRLAVTVHHEEYQGTNSETLEPTVKIGAKVVRERPALQ